MVRPNGLPASQSIRHVHAVNSFFFSLGPWHAENKTNSSFDLCEDSKADTAFFPSTHGAMLGTYQEVSCTGWNGGEGNSLWGGSCMAPDNAPSWPSVACGNEGTKHSLGCAVMQIYLMCTLRISTSVSGRRKFGVVRTTVVWLWTRGRDK